MPQRILPGCTTPGCPARSVRKGKCDEHLPASAKEYDQQRGSSAARGYDYTWQRFAAYLAGKPEYALCKSCLDRGLTVPRAVFDHIIPLAQGGPRLDEKNIQPLCDTIRASTTNHDVQVTIGDDGAEISYRDLRMSLDEQHLINRVEAKLSDATPITAQEDATSQDRYLKRTKDFGTTRYVNAAELSVSQPSRTHCEYGCLSNRSLSLSRSRGMKKWQTMS